MICFPNAKINLGLFVVNKRRDGYHDLESLMIPTGPFDILEFMESEKDSLRITGNITEELKGDNIIFKSLETLRNELPVPPLQIHLHKIIPLGAGLGGGSSDAAFFLKHLNRYLDLGLDKAKLLEHAAFAGSDCPFFIENKASYLFGRGDILEDSKGIPFPFYIRILYPGIHISTKEAYAGIEINNTGRKLREIILSGPENWKAELTNDFEKSIFKKYPEMEKIKNLLYATGADYASMSGSGSSLYAIYRKKKPFPDSLRPMLIWEGDIPAGSPNPVQ